MPTSGVLGLRILSVIVKYFALLGNPEPSPMYLQSRKHDSMVVTREVSPPRTVHGTLWEGQDLEMP